MGIIYKIRPEIKDFIVQEAKAHPELGCRKLSLLIQERFNVEVSKSSINTIIKSVGLSKPVGRRITHMRRKAKFEVISQGNIEKAKAQEAPPIVLPESPAPEEKIILKVPLLNFSPLLKEPIAPGENVETEERKSIFTAPEAREEAATDKRLIPGLGNWFLKAAELSLGGIHEISKALSSAAEGREIGEFIKNNEALLYMPLFGVETPDMLDGLAKARGLFSLLGQEYTKEKIKTYQEYLKPLNSLNILLLTQISSCLVFIKNIKFILNNDSFYFLDGKMHSLWSTSHIPQNFSSPALKAKEYLHKTIILEDSPFVLQAPPGFEAPGKVFFSFIRSLRGDDRDKRIKRIEFYNQHNDFLEAFSPLSIERRNFIIGLWPWQYEKILTVDNTSDFSNFLFRMTGETFSLADSQATIKSQDDEEPIVLRSVILKRGQNKILNILTNIEEKIMGIEQVASLYLEYWPNLELGYQDFLNKIGIESYAVDKIAASAINTAALADTESLTLDRILGFWRIKLNEYCQNYFFPLSYRNLDFSAIKERFYELEGETITQIGHFKVVFNVQSDFRYIEELNYSCQRVNESHITLPGGNILVFEISSK